MVRSLRLSNVNRLRNKIRGGLVSAVLLSLLAVPCAIAAEETAGGSDESLIERIRRHDSRKELRRVGLLGRIVLPSETVRLPHRSDPDIWLRNGPRLIRADRGRVRREVLDDAGVAA